MSPRGWYLLAPTSAAKWRVTASGFAALLLCDTAAQLCFKLAAQDVTPFGADLQWLLRVAQAPWVYGAIAAYAGGFLAWMGLLRHLPLGTAVAASHFDVVVVMLLSVPLFHETLSSAQWIGCALIMGGVVVLAISESRRRAEHGFIHHEPGR